MYDTRMCSRAEKILNKVPCETMDWLDQYVANPTHARTHASLVLYAEKSGYAEVTKAIFLVLYKHIPSFSGENVA